MDFLNKTIWITGASSGMGKATALEISKFGTRVIISDRDLEGLRLTASEIQGLGSTVRIEPLNMMDSEAIIKTAEKVLSEESVAGLYQFAGISQRSFVVDTPVDNDRKIMEINFFGVVTLAKCVLPHMIKNGEGQLAVASSMVGKFGFPYRSAYSASKHALHGFFESLLAENYKNNIHVSLFIGGRIQTNISKFAIDKNGKEHGKMDAGQANGITVEKAAKQIVRGLKRNKKEIKVGGRELLMLKIRKYLPFLYYKLARTINPM